MRPKNQECIREISRQSTLYDILPRPRPTNWKRPRIMEWLESNPVREDDCKAFIAAEVGRLRVTLEQLQQQACESAPAGGGKWRGNVPYLCVILCLTDDDVKQLYLRRADAMTRQELDTRNSNFRYVLSSIPLLLLLFMLCT